MWRIVVIGRDMRRLVAAKLGEAGENGAAPHRLVFIPNWADLDLVRPGPRRENPLLRELGLTDKFVIQYAGNMGRPNAVEDVLGSAVLLRDRPDIHFLFIGGGAKRKWLEEAVQENDLANVTILPNRPRCDQPNFLNACDLAIVPFVPGMTGLGVPSRLYNILAAGKPIIAVAEDGSELAEVVQEEKAGWVIPPGHPAKIVEVIQQAQESPEELACKGKSARAAAESKYSLEHTIFAYEEMVRELVGTNRSMRPSPMSAAGEGRARGEKPR
jgi:glycosyltransferase involved in cell wall biosynthesis